MREAALSLHGIEKTFPVHRSLLETLRRVPGREVRAIDGIDLDVARGEVVAVVGESGCGKTTTANIVMGLLAPSAGSVTVGDITLSSAKAQQLRAMRRRVQMVFQDPYESLNPRMTVGEIVAEPLRVHKVAADAAEEHRLVVAALDRSGLKPAERYIERRPHELSGGQRQRVVIAGALVLEPDVLIADEPVSMLDVSIRAEILNLLAGLAREQGIAILMITHDMSTVAAFSNRIAVMYLGRIVEIGPTRAVLQAPRHPYTEALLSVVPVPHARQDRHRIILEGETPDPSRIPAGCRFHPRCPKVFDECRVVDPGLFDVGNGHAAACLLARPPAG